MCQNPADLQSPSDKRLPTPFPQLMLLVRCPECRRGNLEVVGDPPGELVCRALWRGVPIVGGDSAAGGRVVRRELRPAVEPLRRGAARGGRGDVPGQDRASRPRDLAGRLVLDAGCGGGRYARLVGAHGARVVGVDLSAAVEKAAALCAELPDVAIVQADLLDLPLAEGAFDLVYSIGVCTTPPTRAALSRRSPGGSSREDGWPSGSTAATRRPRSGSTPGSAPSRRACPRGCSSRSAPAWARSAASRCSTAPSTSSPTSRTTPTGPSASATTSTGTPRATSRTTRPRSCKRWFAEEGFADIVELAPAKDGRLYDWAYRPQPHHRQRGQCCRDGNRTVRTLAVYYERNASVAAQFRSVTDV